MEGTKAHRPPLTTNFLARVVDLTRLARLADDLPLGVTQGAVHDRLAVTTNKAMGHFDCISSDISCLRKKRFYSKVHLVRLLGGGALDTDLVGAVASSTFPSPPAALLQPPALVPLLCSHTRSGSVGPDGLGAEVALQGRGSLSEEFLCFLQDEGRCTDQAD